MNSVNQYGSGVYVTKGAAETYKVSTVTKKISDVKNVQAQLSCEHKKELKFSAESRSPSSPVARGNNLEVSDNKNADAAQSSNAKMSSAVFTNNYISVYSGGKSILSRKDFNKAVDEVIALATQFGVETKNFNNMENKVEALVKLHIAVYNHKAINREVYNQSRLLLNEILTLRKLEAKYK
jgi:hypothetical protein